MNMPHRDQIHIRNLRLRCIIGIFPEERSIRQDIILNITLFADLRTAGRSDALEDTVDYKALKREVMAMVESSQFFLIERLAEAVAQICLQYRRVDAVRVTVDKPGALRYADSVAVEIFRERKDSSHA
jgi:D-erythro-7,8-dihydroneopterin triphosphate epimerase